VLKDAIEPLETIYAQSEMSRRLLWSNASAQGCNGIRGRQMGAGISRIKENLMKIYNHSLQPCCL
jgi:hypothetical protein